MKEFVLVDMAIDCLIVFIGDTGLMEMTLMTSNPRCPHCNFKMGGSALIPYYFLCIRCGLYWNPDLSKSTNAMELYKQC